MPNLTEFLLARIAEDEAFAETVQNAPTMSASESRRVQEGNAIALYPLLAMSPARVLAECEAKRRIVHEAQDPGDDLFVRIVALPYADHPDYHEEWRV